LLVKGIIMIMKK